MCGMEVVPESHLGDRRGNHNPSQTTSGKIHIAVCKKITMAERKFTMGSSIEFSRHARSSPKTSITAQPRFVGHKGRTKALNHRSRIDRAYRHFSRLEVLQEKWWQGLNRTEKITF